MDITGEYRLKGQIEDVWRDLNDPEVLKVCIPGCKSLDQTGDNEFSAEVVAKFGPVKATFKSQLRVEESNPPHSYRLVGEGKGGAAGFGKGGADVELVGEDGGTLLKYDANVAVGGKIAQIGSRLFSSTTRKLADQFFSAFAARFEDDAEQQ
ncbi:MAG: carbon monoxide dehydrogenase subunit G [Pseudomonadota bacterium]